MASGTLLTYGTSVDTLLTTTKSVISRGREFLNDAVFSSIPLLNWLNKKARVTRQGGASILVPLLYGKNSTFAAYSGDDIISPTGQEGMAMAQYRWRNYGGTITYTGDEIAMNAGEGKIEDLAKAKTKQAMMSGRDRLAIDLFASTQASKAVSTLVTLIDATSSVADIASSTNSWWQSQVTASGVFSAQGLSDLRDLRDDIIRQGQSGAPAPDFYITTQLIKELYEASQLPSLRYKMGETPDPSMSPVFGGAAVEFDPNATSGVLYALSSEALEFVVHRDFDWAVGDFVEPNDQDVFTAKVIWRGNLITNNRRRLGKLTGITG